MACRRVPVSSASCWSRQRGGDDKVRASPFFILSRSIIVEIELTEKNHGKNILLRVVQEGNCSSRMKISNTHNKCSS